MKNLIKKILREEFTTHDIDVMLNDIKPNCDGCKYFDMDSVERFGGMEHPIYYLIEKKQVHTLDHIKPKQYIHRIANGFGVSYADALGGAYDEEKAKKYAEAMKNGDKFPVGYFVRSKPDQEGRHRAMASLMLDANYIPVVEINNISDSFIKDFVNEYKDYSFEELDKLFKEKGYHGITGLDWRTFKNYIKHNLDEK